MIHIQARIYDGHTATSAGVSGSVGSGCANHMAGGGSIGGRNLFLLHHARLIFGLQNHILDSIHGLNCLNLAIRHIRRDDVGSLAGHVIVVFRADDFHRDFLLIIGAGRWGRRFSLPCIIPQYRFRKSR